MSNTLHQLDTNSLVQLYKSLGGIAEGKDAFSNHVDETVPAAAQAKVLDELHERAMEENNRFDAAALIERLSPLGIALVWRFHDLGLQFRAARLSLGIGHAETQALTTRCAHVAAELIELHGIEDVEEAVALICS